MIVDFPLSYTPYWSLKCENKLRFDSQTMERLGLRSLLKSNFCYFLLCLALANAQRYGDNQVEIETSMGRIKGFKAFSTEQKSDYFAFIGIPYAQPPIGHLRFRPPVPITGN